MKEHPLNGLVEFAATQQNLARSIADLVSGIAGLPARPPASYGSVFGHFFTLAKRLREQDDRAKLFEENARDLGASGWTIPTSWSTEMVLDVLGSVEEVGDYDDIFEEYYSMEGGNNLRDLTKRLQHRASLQDWRPLLVECIECFYREQYQVIVPALLVVYEGSLIQAASSLAPNTKVKKAVSSRRKSSRAGLERLLWASVEGFTLSVYENVHFSEHRPRLTNRHWVQHGRDRAGWQRIDSLRLLHAIDSLPE
jgi:hypothetical protein